MITHDGFIRLCLHADEEIDLRNFLHKPIMFKEVIKEIYNGIRQEERRKKR